MADDRSFALAALLRDVADAEDRAAQAFSSTLELISGEVAVRWADPLPPEPGPGGRPVTHMPIIDVRYAPAPGRAAPAECWGGAQFEWSFGISELRDDHAGEVAFAAGVFVPRGEAPSCLDDDDWLTARRAEGFEQFHNLRLGGEQLIRWLDIADVLVAGEPADQADLTAEWIVSTFEALANEQPANRELRRN